MLLDVGCVFFQKLYTDFIFFYKPNIDCVFYPVVTNEVTSAHPSLLVVTVATGVFYPSLLSYYHYNDRPVSVVTQ
jgi:hypothetical protein